jgi:hypothetical protein
MTGLARDPFRLTQLKGSILDNDQVKLSKEKIDLAISYGYIEKIIEEKVEVVKPKKKRTVKNKK